MHLSPPEPDSDDDDSGSDSSAASASASEDISRGDRWCGVEVTVVGGYEDERGDAAKAEKPFCFSQYFSQKIIAHFQNSMSLLRALHEEPRLVEVRHFCVGPYNTRDTEPGERNGGGAVGPKTAILKGEKMRDLNGISAYEDFCHV